MKIFLFFFKFSFFFLSLLVIRGDMKVCMERAFFFSSLFPSFFFGWLAGGGWDGRQG